MKKFIRTAVDLGKNYFQFHGLASEDGVPVSRKLKRAKVLEFYAQIEPCRVGMEACGSAHHWARELMAMGHEVVLIPPAYIKPYVKRGKNDAVDGQRSARRWRARTCALCRSKVPMIKPC